MKLVRKRNHQYARDLCAIAKSGGSVRSRTATFALLELYNR
jgi:hypothetical protein